MLLLLFLHLHRRVMLSGNVSAAIVIQESSVPNAEQKSLKIGFAPAETQIKVSSARNAENLKVKVIL